ncbi:MAG: hypothetical protein PHS86_00905 [Syntrophaceae bacterium]|nr:hypothetical protein [Syntrophaceae bacterium]
MEPSNSGCGSRHVFVGVLGIKLLLVFFLFVGNYVASAAELSRPVTKELLEASSKIRSLGMEVYMHPNAFPRGIQQGMWTGEPWQNDLTAKGIQYLQRLADAGTRMVLKQPIGVTLEITGIADAILMSGMKEAKFTWAYVGLPSILKRYAVFGGTGTALLRLYDDGWRVEDISLSFSDTPAPLTDDERAS